VPCEVLPFLRDAVEKHIVEHGVTEFIVGHYGGFDRMAADAVIAAKKAHPHVLLSLLLPYHPAERPIKNRRALLTPTIRREWKRFLAIMQSSAPISIW